MMNHEQQFFPGFEPKPGKIIVSRAEPMTIEEKEGIKYDEGRRDNLYRGTKTQELEPKETPAAPIQDPAPQASDAQESSKDSSRGREERSGRPQANNQPIARHIVKWTSSLLAALSALMSWYYSFEWFRDKLPNPWRFFLPIIIVGCSVMLPQVALIFLNRKGVKYKGASLAVFLIGLLASSFSMLSTIAGIYNANSESINRRSAAIVSAQADSDARAELVRIDEEIARLNREIDSTQAKVDAIPTEDTLKGDSQALMRRLNNAKKSKQDYEAKRAKAEKILEETRRTGDTSQTVREDFNSFLGRQFKIDSGRVEFAMAAAPALLLDVVAPILGAVALFL